MGIFSHTGEGESITEGWRALELFTNRHQLIREFITNINDEPPDQRIHFFYGDGGNGKSLLIRFLREQCCKRFKKDDWDWIKIKPDPEFITEIKQAEGTEPVPCALIDFGMPLRGDEDLRQAFPALLKLRRDFSRFGIQFPLFDYSCIYYLFKTHQLNEDQLRRLFPAEEMDFIAGIADAVSKTSVGALAKSILSLFDKHLRERFSIYKLRRKLNDEQVNVIQRMDPERELIDRLPILFAEDLNASMPSDDPSKRVIMFFDTHEAFWGAKERDLSNELFFYRDEWLRRLLGTLDYERGIMAVVSGRERPRWHQATRSKIPETYLNVQHIDCLSDEDASQYLEQAGINNNEILQCLLDYARIAPNQVHPFYLGLCADVVLAASGKGVALTPKDFEDHQEAVDKGKLLIERLLRYVDAEVNFAVRALSACRAFDQEILLRLGRTLNFNASEPTFHLITRFSFVWQSDQKEKGWYKIHDLLRRLFQDQGEEVTYRAHRVMEGYYRERASRGEALATVEAIYHANRLDWARAVQEWQNLFNAALQRGHYAFCRPLLELLSDLIIKSDFSRGDISYSAGDYFSNLMKPKEAIEEFLKAIAAYDSVIQVSPNDAVSHNNKGIALARMAERYGDLALYEQSDERFKEALLAFDRALQLTPAYIQAQINKGTTLQCKGSLMMRLSKHEEANQAYQIAIQTFDEALHLSPSNSYIENNKGNAYRDLGRLQANLSHHTLATESFVNAINCFDRALQYNPALNLAYSNKAITFACLGDLQFELSQYESSLESYTKSVSNLDEAIGRAPDNVLAYNNKGATLLHIGRLQAALSNYQQAELSFKAAIAACDDALERAPSYVNAYVNKGNSLNALADLYDKLSRYDEALTFFIASIESYDNALSIAPNEVIVHHNKGASLRNLAKLYVALARYDDARQSYSAAILTLDEALRRAPHLVAVLNDKGITSARLGELQMELSLYEEAFDSYTKALVSFDHALELAPSDVAAHNSKGSTLQQLGDLFSRQNKYDEAANSFEKAIEVFQEALRLSPNDIQVFNNLGNVLRSLADAQVALSRPEQANTSFMSCLDAYDKALSGAPTDTITLANKAAALGDYGLFLRQISKPVEARECFEKAISTCDLALQSAPYDLALFNNKGGAHLKLGQLQADLHQHESTEANYELAIDLFDQVIQRAPDDIYVRSNKGLALANLGVLQQNLVRYQEAIETFGRAIVEFSYVLDLSPGLEEVRQWKDQAQDTIIKLRQLNEKST